ncbi:MAG: zinc ABC transporter substrate-binding protein [Planctomycetota bacterium]
MSIFKSFATILLCVPVLFLGCAADEDVADGDSTSDSKSNVHVIATTGQIHSALQAITEGTDVKLQLFCGPGVDTHSFSASTNDVQAMMDADLIVYNGFHLEAKLSEHLDDTFKEKAWSMASSFPESGRLDWVEDGEVDPDAPFDPHIWNDLPGWSECVAGLTEKLSEMVPRHAEQFGVNGTKYTEELMANHKWASEMLAKLPEDRRTIISGHDAFGYFAKNYGMKTGAPLGVGNDAEADIKTMRELATMICDEKIPAIFVETISNEQVSKALSEACEARGWNVEIVDQPLYSDDLGEEPPANTFLGAFKSNVEVIYNALSRKE